MKPFSSGKLIFVSFSQVADLDLGGVGERRGVSGSKRSKIILMPRTYYSGSVTKCFETNIVITEDCLKDLISRYSRKGGDYILAITHEF